MRLEARGAMAIREQIAHVPYAELKRAFAMSGPWTCVACGGSVGFRAFGHEPHPHRPLFECARCGRRSDGCQTFEGHHALYGACALSGDVPSRCGHWLCGWQKAQGLCPVCGAVRVAAPEEATARRR